MSKSKKQTAKSGVKTPAQKHFGRLVPKRAGYSQSQLRSGGKPKLFPGRTGGR